MLRINVRIAASTTGVVVVSNTHRFLLSLQVNYCATKSYRCYGTVHDSCECWL